MPPRVAPHAGAWIEIDRVEEIHADVDVAPHAGAWIEMLNESPNAQTDSGRSPRGSVD